MTTKELTQRYREIIQRHGLPAPAEKCDTADFSADVETTRKHLLWMLDEMDKMMDAMAAFGGKDVTPKWHAWRGFVQGVLWMMDWRTIDEMRDDTRGLEYFI